MSKPSLVRISLVRVLTQTNRQYNLVRRNFYDVNYVYTYIALLNEKERNLEHELYRRFTVFVMAF